MRHLGVGGAIHDDGKPAPWRRHMRRWGAVWVLLTFFIGSWTGQLVTQRIAWVNEQVTHGESTAWADYWPEFWSSTLENWQSEWLQLVFQALLLLGPLSLLIWKADTQADQTDVERLEAKIDRLLGDRC